MRILLAIIMLCTVPAAHAFDLKSVFKQEEAVPYPKDEIYDDPFGDNDGVNCAGHARELVNIVQDDGVITALEDRRRGDFISVPSIDGYEDKMTAIDAYISTGCDDAVVGQAQAAYKSQNKKRLMDYF